MTLTVAADVGLVTNRSRGSLGAGDRRDGGPMPSDHEESALSSAPKPERLEDTLQEKAARKEKDKKHYQRLQMVMLRTQGLTQPAIAVVVERAGL